MMEKRPLGLGTGSSSHCTRIQACKKGVCSVHVAYLHLAFSVFMFHLPSTVTSTARSRFQSSFTRCEKRVSLPYQELSILAQQHSSLSDSDLALETCQTMEKVSASGFQKMGCREFFASPALVKFEILMRDNFFDSIKATYGTISPGIVFTDFFVWCDVSHVRRHFGAFLLESLMSDMLGL